MWFLWSFLYYSVKLLWYSAPSFFSLTFTFITDIILSTFTINSLEFRKALWEWRPRTTVYFLMICKLQPLYMCGYIATSTLAMFCYNWTWLDFKMHDFHQCYMPCLRKLTKRKLKSCICPMTWKCNCLFLGQCFNLP